MIYFNNIFINKLHEKSLKAAEYFLLYCVHLGKKDIDKLVDWRDIQSLLRRGLISTEVVDSFLVKDMEITEAGKDVLYDDFEFDEFNTKEDSYTMSDVAVDFELFYNTYPVSTLGPNGVGTRYFREDKDRCKKIYKEILAEGVYTSDLLLKALKYEKDVRERESSFEYMKNMKKWLDTKYFIVLLDAMRKEKKETPKLDEGYGHKLE